MNTHQNEIPHNYVDSKRFDFFVCLFVSKNMVHISRHFCNSINSNRSIVDITFTFKIEKIQSAFPKRKKTKRSSNTLNLVHFDNC